jgi:hypothetical protein
VFMILNFSALWFFHVSLGGFLHEPYALSLRVLKALRFPYDDLLEAQLGSSVSQVWCAVH